MAAYSAHRTPGWGNSLAVVLSSDKEGEIVEGVSCGLVPMRSEPSGELVRVNFLGDAIEPRRLGDLKAAIQDEIAPIIVGVGKIWAKHALEGFKVFWSDERQVSSGHDCPSVVCEPNEFLCEMPPEMIRAGTNLLSRMRHDLRWGHQPETIDGDVL